MTKILLIQCSEVLEKMLQYINIWNEKKKNIMDIFHDQDNSVAYIAMQQQR